MAIDCVHPPFPSHDSACDRQPSGRKRTLATALRTLTSQWLRRGTAPGEPALSLRHLSDRALQDLGLTRAGVTAASHQPTATDAAVALQTLSLQRPPRY